MMDLYLFGKLASHRRGAVISDYLPVKPLEAETELPSHGALIMFGQEWQAYTGLQQSNLMKWIKSSGRAVLLIPPYNNGALTGGIDWQVENVSGDKSTPLSGLAQYLSDEARFQFKAISHQFLREYAHNWEDDTLNTLYYKPHSNAGLFAASSLPIWSLTCLDIPGLVHSWLSGLYEIAGKIRDEPIKANTAFVLNDKHLALLCCAYGQKFKDKEALVGRVGRLGVFRLLPVELDSAVTDLAAEGLFVEGELSEKGVKALTTSPYKIYADELKRMPS